MVANARADRDAKLTARPEIRNVVRCLGSDGFAMTIGNLFMRFLVLRFSEGSIYRFPPHLILAVGEVQNFRVGEVKCNRTYTFTRKVGHARCFGRKKHDAPGRQEASE